MKIEQLVNAIEKYLFFKYTITSNQVRVVAQSFEGLVFITCEGFISNKGIDGIEDIHNIIYNHFWEFLGEYNIYGYDLDFAEYKFIPENKQLQRIRKEKLKKLFL